jgi:hypothetical protein
MKLNASPAGWVKKVLASGPVGGRWKVEKGRLKVVGNYLLWRGKGRGNRWLEQKGGKDP